MQIVDYIIPEGILLDLRHKIKEKQEAIFLLVQRMNQSGHIQDAAAYQKAVFQREMQISTGLDRGIAIPHAKSKAVIKPGICLLISRNGIAYPSLDHRPVHLVFLLAVPDTEQNLHLEMLSSLSSLLRDDPFREALQHAGSAEEARALLTEATLRGDRKEV